MKTVRQVVALQPGQRVDAGAAHRQLVPDSRLAYHGGPAFQVAGDASHHRIHQQVDRVVIDVAGEPVLDGEHQGGQAAFGPAFRQALGVGMDRSLGLPVQQAGGGPPQEHRQRGGTGREQQRIDRGEAQAGGAKNRERRAAAA